MAYNFSNLYLGVHRRFHPNKILMSRFSFRHEMRLATRKPPFCICDNKDADQLRGNRKADQRLCFRYTDSQIPPKFQASRHFLWLYSRVCVEPGRKPQRPVFSRRGSNCAIFDHSLVKIVLYELQFHGHHSYFRKYFQMLRTPKEGHI